MVYHKRAKGARNDISWSHNLKVTMKPVRPVIKLEYSTCIDGVNKGLSRTQSYDCSVGRFTAWRSKRIRLGWSARKSRRQRTFSFSPFVHVFQTSENPGMSYSFCKFSRVLCLSVPKPPKASWELAVADTELEGSVHWKQRAPRRPRRSQRNEMRCSENERVRICNILWICNVFVICNVL